MESTAEYWLKPFWTLTEVGIKVLVANALQTKTTQGKKTDKEDADRIAIAFRDGRLKPSVVCSPDQYSMRKLSRHENTYLIKKS
ncbi:MAG: IS110 family transposase [Promethearchaeota archaeon]